MNVTPIIIFAVNLLSVLYKKIISGFFFLKTMSIRKIYIYLPNPSARAGCNARSIFMHPVRCKVGLGRYVRYNSEKHKKKKKMALFNFWKMNSFF